MANDLSTPLTGRRRRNQARSKRFHFPLARLLFGLIFLIIGGIALRLVLVDDPDGGRPSEEVAITSTRDGNAIANSAASRPATITADPEQHPAGSSIVAVPPPTAFHSVGHRPIIRPWPGRPDWSRRLRPG